MDDYNSKYDSAMNYSKAINYLTDLLVEDDLLIGDDSLFYVVSLGLLDRLQHLFGSKLDELTLSWSQFCCNLDISSELTAIELLQDKLTDVFKAIDCMLKN